MTLTYADFLRSKRRLPPASGITVHPDDLLSADALFPFQRQIVAWAVGRGRAAIWADTGLGKTRMQVAWAQQLIAAGGRALILAPLAVAHQTVREAAKVGVEVVYVRDQVDAEASDAAIVITNYERLDKIDPAKYRAVVLDESSILKAFSGSTKRALVGAFDHTEYRLSASATPAPNDLEELCNHADFLGIMTPQEMRSTFFIADSRGEFMKYRLKGHAARSFYEWLASWAIACRHPRDLGFTRQGGYDLPRLSILDHIVPTGWAAEGELFTPRLEGVSARAQVRKETLEARCDAAAELVGAEPGRQWLVWVGRNDESTGMARRVADLMPDADAVEVVGTDGADVKADALARFADGEIRVLITKPTIAGAGMNFQSCNRMVFVGLSDSYEQYYQAIRRCWRFGQAEPVDAHIVVADVEDVIVRNVRAKEKTAQATTDGLIAAIASENRRELYEGTSKSDSYEPCKDITIPIWLRSAAV